MAYSALEVTFVALPAVAWRREPSPQRRGGAVAGAGAGAGPGVNDDEPPWGAARDEEPAATYSPGPAKAKYHRRCGA
jgi:hypothetical protein